MAGSIIQQAYGIDDSGTGYSTWNTTGLTGVTAGSTIVVIVGYGYGGGQYAVSGVNDGSAYTQAGAAAVNSSSGQASSVWYRANVGSGTITPTVSISGGSAQYVRVRVLEIGGVDASPFDQATQAGYDGSSPSSGATSATTNANDFVLGFVQNCFQASPGDTITAGSGYSYYGTNYIMGVESKSVTSTGAQTATFSGTNGNYTVHVLALKESGASQSNAPRAAAYYRMMRGR